MLTFEGTQVQGAAAIITKLLVCNIFCKIVWIRIYCIMYWGGGGGMG